MKNEVFHIGSIIRAELSRQGRSVAWLAKQLNIQRPNCYRILRAGSIHTDMLMSISITLNHDFFAVFSEKLEKRKIE